MTEPSYTQTAWANAPATSSPVDETNLNHIEQGVADAIARATKSIRYDAAQSLNPTQQSLAQGNLGLGGMATAQPGAYTGLPSYVGPRTKPFDADSSLYNGTSVNLRNLRALLNSTRQGGTCRISFIGDSTTAGAGATAGTSYPVQLRALLAAAGYPVKGTGLAFAGQGVTDPRWATTGTVTDSGQMSQMSAAATKTFSSDLTGDAVDIRFYRHGGTFDVLVDTAIVASGVTVTGGTYNTSTGRVTPDGTSAAGKVTITGLASATHVVKVTSTATTYLIGIDVYANTGAGIAVSNMGVASTKSGDWTATGFVTNYQMATLEPADCFVVALGVNDGVSAVPVATFKTNLTTLVTSLLTIAPVILVAQINSSGVPAATQQTYVSAIYDVADTKDVPVVDLMHRWGSYSALNTLGLIADTINMNSKGYADWAQALNGGLDLGGGGSGSGSGGGILIPGGATGNVLAKASGTDYDTQWLDLSTALPSLTVGQGGANALTLQPGSLAATGTGTDINVGVRSKGAGSVQVNGSSGDGTGGLAAYTGGATPAVRAQLGGPVCCDLFPAAADYALRIAKNGEASYRLRVLDTAVFNFGDGAGTFDAPLSRLAAGTLGTTAAWRIGSSNTAGRPAAATVGAGAQWYDTTLGMPLHSNGTAFADSLGVVTPLATKTANYSMVKGDRIIVSNGTGLTIGLPDPTTVNPGREYIVKNINASAATVNSQGTSKTLDGAASQSLVQWESLAFVSDGTQWLIV